MCQWAGDPESTYVSFVLMIILIIVIIIKNMWIIDQLGLVNEPGLD